MLLLLIRHAKAQERGIVPERERALTKEGREKIEKAYPPLARALQGRSVRLISSPLVRAYQTAEVLERELGKEMEMAEWVVQGDTNALLRAIHGTKEEVLLLFGHEPTFSYWSNRLGQEVEWLKKGAATLFAVEESIEALGYYPLGKMEELAQTIQDYFDSSDRG